MATFKCLQSGNTVTFTQQHDIDSMKGHGGYVLVEDTPPKPVGRPRKVVAEEANHAEQETNASPDAQAAA